MRKLAALEPDNRLDLVARFKKSKRFSRFYVEIMHIDTGRHADFLDFDNALVLGALRARACPVRI